jgi:hypothetical protein
MDLKCGTTRRQFWMTVSIDAMLRRIPVVLMVSVFTLVCHAQDPVLPFTFKVKERTENLPVYVSPPGPNLYNNNTSMKVGWGIDSPTGLVVIEGEVWVMFNLGNQYGTHVKIARFKGTDFEHTARQADGSIEVEKGVSTHFCGGMWYDSVAGKLFAPIHCEYEREISPPAGWTRKKTRLATSTDKGLTWNLEGDILTDYLPSSGDWLKFSGAYFEPGPADFDFYVDNQGGYFYIYSCNSYAPKNGTMNNFLWYNEVARCAISDKMAPGTWHKFCNGTWTEPGLGGKASKVGMGSYGMYGRVIYSRSLKKYLRIGVRLGVIDKRFTNLGFGDGSILISASDDLSRQEWTPAAKLLDVPGNDKFGFTLTDGNAVDPFVCDRSIRAYNYWLYNIPSRAVDMTLGEGKTATAGYPRYGSYAYEPLPESGDSIVSRRTKIVGCTSPENIYAGPGWTIRSDSRYYQAQVMECSLPGNSVQYSFKGPGIYWRAIADTNGGKADVYLDGKFVETVDCYFREALPFQFAFIKTGLDPNASHVFKAVVRTDKNTESRGTVIRHMAFEYSAESYRASAGFSGVIGKNNWHYNGRTGQTYVDLRFLDFVMTTVQNKESGEVKEQKSFANYWWDEGGSTVGDNYQIPGEYGAVRTWVSPHSGRIRIEGMVRFENDRGSTAKIVQNVHEAWSSSVDHRANVSHDLAVTVKRGDAIRFVVEKNGGSKGERVIWDPVVTYEEK